MQKLVFSAAVLATLALAACDGSNGGNNSPASSTAPATSTVPALAVSSIDGDTCANGIPLAIDRTTFVDDQEQIDVSSLKPACAH